MSAFSATVTYPSTCEDGIAAADDVAAKSWMMMMAATVWRASLAARNCLAREGQMRGRKVEVEGERVAWRAARVKADVVVAKDRSGDYRSIGEGLKLALAGGKERDDRFVIYVKEGVYEEEVKVTAEMNYIIIYGDGPHRTVVTGSKGFDDGISLYGITTFASTRSLLISLARTARLLSRLSRLLSRLPLISLTCPSSLSPSPFPPCSRPLLSRLRHSALSFTIAVRVSGPPIGATVCKSGFQQQDLPADDEIWFPLPTQASCCRDRGCCLRLPRRRCLYLNHPAGDEIKSLPQSPYQQAPYHNSPTRSESPASKLPVDEVRVPCQQSGLSLLFPGNEIEVPCQQAPYRNSPTRSESLASSSIIDDGLIHKVYNPLYSLDLTGYIKCDEVTVFGFAFVAKDMGFAGPAKAQAVALLVQADLSVFYNFWIDGYQNTLLAHTHRQFYCDYTINGAIDVISGDRCVPKLPNCPQAASSGPEDRNHCLGPFGQNCTIAAGDDLSQARHQKATYLGRPAKEQARTVIMQSEIGDVVAPEGWSLGGSESEWEKCLYFGEFGNRGPGSDVAGRVRWKGYHVMIDAAKATAFNAYEFIHGKWWLNLTGAPFYTGLDH
ncbi:hypothetical protein ACLOJK_040743 [Asimina triloba]